MPPLPHAAHKRRFVFVSYPGEKAPDESVKKASKGEGRCCCGSDAAQGRKPDSVWRDVDAISFGLHGFLPLFFRCNYFLILVLSFALFRQVPCFLQEAFATSIFCFLVQFLSWAQLQTASGPGRSTDRVRIGRPGYRVTKLRDERTRQFALLCEVEYPEIVRGTKPYHR